MYIVYIVTRWQVCGTDVPNIQGTAGTEVCAQRFCFFEFFFEMMFDKMCVRVLEKADDAIVYYNDIVIVTTTTTSDEQRTETERRSTAECLGTRFLTR